MNIPKHGVLIIRLQTVVDIGLHIYTHSSRGKESTPIFRSIDREPSTTAISLIRYNRKQYGMRWFRASVDVDEASTVNHQQQPSFSYGTIGSSTACAGFAQV